MESIEHAELVDLLYSEVNRVCDTRRLFYFSDSHTSIGRNSPPAIENYIPDIAYQDISGTFVIIGEAKTYNDLNNKHTYLQISAFARQIYLQDTGTLVVSVPPTCEKQMISLINSICNKNSIDGISFHVISKIYKIQDGQWL